MKHSSVSTLWVCVSFLSLPLSTLQKHAFVWIAAVPFKMCFFAKENPLPKIGWECLARAGRSLWVGSSWQSAGKKKEENDPPKISSLLVLPLPFSVFSLWLSPFIWKCRASLGTMPSTEGSWSVLVPRHQCNKLGWVIFFKAAVSAGPLHWHRRIASV